ncbi:MAG: amidohydrolase [Deltaproteobacteria bacterium]|nr:amidohydrolase [Deltaproteobacteria bacterium]
MPPSSTEKQRVFDRIRVVDVDTHISEPEDLWTSRVASKWGDLIPHVVKAPGGNTDFWAIGDSLVVPTGMAAMAEFDGTYPDFPETLAQAIPASHDAQARLDYMDREGIYASVLYPNVAGFGSGRFLQIGEPALMLECVQAYNDFLVEWVSAAPDRLVPVMATPFWDVEASVAEIERCAAQGHKGILFGSQPQSFGEPHLADPHWDPIWAAAQAAQLPISFHIGSGQIESSDAPGTLGPAFTGGYPGWGLEIGLVKTSVLLFMDNIQSIADVIFGGVCQRYPRLAFVSVESGAGWIPFALEAFDWQWRNNGAQRAHPEFDLLPSEYFARQIYGCFWFEEAAAAGAIERYPENFLYETDFPHPTSMSPGPQSAAEHPRDYVERAWSELEEKTLQAVFHDNAARLYGLE